jgi:hypothetical protein
MPKSLRRCAVGDYVHCSVRRAPCGCLFSLSGPRQPLSSSGQCFFNHYAVYQVWRSPDLDCSRWRCARLETRPPFNSRSFAPARRDLFLSVNAVRCRLRELLPRRTHLTARGRSMSIADKPSSIRTVEATWCVVPLAPLSTNLLVTRSDKQQSGGDAA